MRENCTYGSMRGRTYPAGASRSTLLPPGAQAARIAGIDAHVWPGRPITALIMEATSGDPDGWRLFAHSSVETVARIVRVLTATKRYAPRQSGQKVYLTHLARTLHGSHEEISARVPSPLAPAFDGLASFL